MPSQFAPALAYVLGFEDPHHYYHAVPDDPEGSHAIAGINSHAWPSQYVDIASFPQASLAQVAAVANFYQTEFWTPLLLQNLDSQDVANRVMDMGVNGGLAGATRLLQRCVSSFGQRVVVDGDMGPLTIMAANQVDPQKLLAAYRAARVAHYEAIAENNPAEAQYLEQWETRARA